MFLYSGEFTTQVIKNLAETNTTGGEHIEKSEGGHIGYVKSKSKEIK